MTLRGPVELEHRGLPCRTAGCGPIQNSLSGAGRTPTPATELMIATLIERAAASFDRDRSASRGYLFRALSLSRIQRAGRERLAAARRSESRGFAAWQFDLVTTFIDTNLGRSIQTEELASLLRLSRSHFTRTFRRTVGVSLMDYVLGQRVEMAKKLMLDTQESLAQISLACGFSDQSYFCRRFKRFVGERPASWRRRNARGPLSAQSADVVYIEPAADASRVKVRL